MNKKMDWSDVGKCDAPADHDEAFRSMSEMRESIRNLVHWAKLQNNKLRSPEILTEINEEGESGSPQKSEDQAPPQGGDG